MSTLQLGEAVGTAAAPLAGKDPEFKSSLFAFQAPSPLVPSRRAALAPMSSDSNRRMSHGVGFFRLF